MSEKLFKDIKIGDPIYYVEYDGKIYHFKVIDVVKRKGIVHFRFCEPTLLGGNSRQFRENDYGFGGYFSNLERAEKLSRSRKKYLFKEKMRTIDDEIEKLKREKIKLNEEYCNLMTDEDKYQQYCFHCQCEGDIWNETHRKYEFVEWLEKGKPLYGGIKINTTLDEVLGDMCGDEDMW